MDENAVGSSASSAPLRSLRTGSSQTGREAMYDSTLQFHDQIREIYTANSEGYTKASAALVKYPG
jgi:hypothetical protein